MKALLALVLVAVLIVPAAALDPSNHAPAKPAGNAASPPPSDPEVLRQGGDTIEDAVAITIPADLTGTTIGYSDDYDEVCPYTASNALDVVYRFVAEDEQLLDLDMCGSSYDTKIYVYADDGGLDLIACNDDFYADDECGVYTSKIEEMPVQQGMHYYVVVDGYMSSWGDYLLTIAPSVPCELPCPAGSETEGEPPLADGYVDLYNGGCNTSLTDPPIQPLTASLFCGVSGWYMNGITSFRDTDWFEVQIPPGGVLEITGDAEEPCYMFELGPQDCGEVAVIQSEIIGGCYPASMTIAGEPGATVWFWVGPAVFDAPGGLGLYEFDYVLETNLETVAVEACSWTAVKGLFR